MSVESQFKNQEFSIKANQRKGIVRQDRHFASYAKHILIVKNDEFEIDNYSSFGIMIKTTEQTFDTGKINASYFVNDQEICALELKYIRRDEDGQISFSIEGQPLAVESIQAFEQSYQLIKQFESETSKFENVPELYKSKTYEFKSWLESLDKQVSAIEKNSFEMTSRELQYYEEAITQTISQYLEQKLPVFAQEMGITIASKNSDIIKSCYEFLRYHVGPIFYKSSFGNRVYTKPRGYAGDYEMMNNVYFNELRGATLFAKCIHRFFTDSSAGQAIRNRAEYLTNKIEMACLKNKNAKILSVASGPAREIQNLFLENPEIASKCEIHLLDQDAEALKFSQRDILEICRQKNIKPNLHFHNVDIKNLINEGLPVNGFDFIYSAGLFDYFTDPVAQFVANKLYSALNEGGSLIIGNFNTNNPAQFIMEALGDWYLIYRNEENLKEIFSRVTDKLCIECEKEGLNLFAVMEK